MDEQAKESIGELVRLVTIILHDDRAKANPDYWVWAKLDQRVREVLDFLVKQDEASQ